MSDLIVPEVGIQMTVDTLQDQVNVIRDVMKKVMVVDTHYGKIPGCGNKPALLQPGAHKLGLLFNLAPKFVIVTNELPGEHREYDVTCELTHRVTDKFIGEGVGVCSTRESKYRFRSEDTGASVPKEYWEGRDRDLIGGATFSVKKVDGKWRIVQRVEHDNPADYYNTSKKIAKKRAYNDAILIATAASDLFVPDDNNMGDGEVEQQTASQQQTVSQPRSHSNKSNGKKANENQRKMVSARLESAEININIFEGEFGQIDALPYDSVNRALEWIANFQVPPKGPAY